MPLHLAAAQVVSLRDDVVGNIERHIALLELAADRGAEFVVFPELSLTGYELDLADDLAFQIENSRWEPLVSSCDRLGVTFAVGAPLRLSTGLHIGAIVLQPHRELQVYTKRHLHEGEDRYFVAGDSDPLLDIAGRKISLAICADTSHASHPARAAQRGAEIYAAGVFFTPNGFGREEAKLIDYAQRHDMTIVLANSGGPAAGYESAGQSSIWSPAGELVARLEGCGAGLALASMPDPRVHAEEGWTGSAIRA